jgi:hypothetical protein
MPMDARTKEGKGAQAKKETGREKFLRLAPVRMETALKKISLVGNLAGPGYQHESYEATQIIKALTEAVDDVAHKFNKAKSGKKGFVFVPPRRAG